MSPEREPPDGRRPDGNLLDPESFWEASAREAVDAPDAELDVELDIEAVDTDVFLVSAGQAQQPPAVVSRPAVPATARPRTAARRPVRRAPALPPLTPPEIPGRGTGEARAGTGLAERLAWLKIPLALLVVAGLFSGLGWYFVGRHPEAPPVNQAGEAAAGKTRALPGKARATPAESELTSRTQAAAAAPEAAEEASPATVKLTVLSDPSSAEVLVDGKFRGLTPLSVEGLPQGGEVAVRVETQGYRPWEQRLSLDTDQAELQITAGLQEDEGCAGGTGWVYVVTEPAGASVELDGKRLPGKTPMVIDKVCASAPHKLLVQSPGRQAWDGTVEVQAGEVHNLNLELPR